MMDIPDESTFFFTLVQRIKQNLLISSKGVLNAFENTLEMCIFTNVK